MRKRGRTGPRSGQGNGKGRRDDGGSGSAGSGLGSRPGTGSGTGIGGTSPGVGQIIQRLAPTPGETPYSEPVIDPRSGQQVISPHTGKPIRVDPRHSIEIDTPDDDSDSDYEPIPSKSQTKPQKSRPAPEPEYDDEPDFEYEPSEKPARTKPEVPTLPSSKMQRPASPVTPPITPPVTTATPAPELPSAKMQRPASIAHDILLPQTEPAPSPKPTAAPSDKSFPNIDIKIPKEPVRQFPTATAAAPSEKPFPDIDLKMPKEPVRQFPNAFATSPKVISTTEPSTWSVNVPSDKTDTGKPSTASSASAAPAASTTATPTKIDLPTVTAPAEKPATVKPSQPDDTASVELMPMSQADQEKIFGKMPSSTTSKKGDPDTTSGKPTPSSSASAGTSGADAGGSSSAASGASGQTGGSASSKSYVPITPSTISGPISGEPSWAEKQRAAAGTPFDTDPKISKSDLTGIKGSFAEPSDTNVNTGNKATIMMNPDDAAKAKTNIFKPDDTDSNDNDSTRPFLTITKSSKPTESKSVFSESVNRLRHLAGLK